MQLYDQNKTKNQYTKTNKILMALIIITILIIMLIIVIMIILYKNADKKVALVK